MVGAENPFLALNHQKRTLPGQLRQVLPVPQFFVTKLLAEERPDMDTKQLTSIEATMLDNYLRSRSELMGGECLYTEDNSSEENRNFTRYEIQLKYNEGRYSAVYLAYRTRCINNELQRQDSIPFIVKIALRKNSARSAQLLRNEARILQEVGNKRFDQKKLPLTPVLIDHGRASDMHFLIMTPLDRNLSKIREDCGGKFSPATSLHVAIETLNTLADFHGKNLVHRDIKPTNYCSGLEDQSHRIFLIDCANAVKKNQTVCPRLGVPDGMTLPYLSLEVHQTGDCSQRGDLESWFYMILELIEPRAMTWSKDIRVDDAEEKKKRFWRDKSQLENKTLLAVAEIVGKMREVVFPKDHMAVKQKFIEALEQHGTPGQKWRVDWVKPKPIQVASPKEVVPKK